MIQFYTYLYLREDFTPYYVGKGKSVSTEERAKRSVTMKSIRKERYWNTYPKKMMLVGS